MTAEESERKRRGDVLRRITESLDFPRMEPHQQALYDLNGFLRNDMELRPFYDHVMNRICNIHTGVSLAARYRGHVHVLNKLNILSNEDSAFLRHISEENVRRVQDLISVNRQQIIDAMKILDHFYDEF